jgi:hypothetical protein
MMRPWIHQKKSVSVANAPSSDPQSSFLKILSRKYLQLVYKLQQHHTDLVKTFVKAFVFRRYSNIFPGMRLVDKIGGVFEELPSL